MREECSATLTYKGLAPTYSGAFSGTSSLVLADQLGLAFDDGYANPELSDPTEALTLGIKTDQKSSKDIPWAVYCMEGRPTYFERDITLSN